MERVELNAGNGRRLFLERVSGRDVDPVWSFRATLLVQEATVTTIVYEHGRRLVAYFRELADGWRGFDGVTSFVSLEGQLMIDASHDGLGTVWCDVRLREPARPTWDFGASLGVEAGTQLDKLAGEIDTFVGDR